MSRAVWLSAVTLVAVVVVGLASPVATGAPLRPGNSAAATAAGARSWVRLYGGPAGGLDAASALAASPAGKVIFVTGVSASAKSSWDYATVAYAAGTGARLWVRRYTGPGKRRDQAAAVAVSPGGSRVFVTGSSRGAGSGPDYATVAYAAGTGAQLWARRYDGPSSSIDGASSAAVSPDGKTVFIAGQSFNSDSGSYDCVTIAYNAATGTRQWLRRYQERVNINDLPCRLAVGPAGRNVYVTGAGLKSYTIVAYSAAAGRQLWTRSARSSHSLVQAASVAVSPRGGRVYLTGEQIAAASAPDYLTVAYSAATGTRQWARRYNGTGNGSDVATSVAVSRDGSTVFVTGYSDGTNLGYEYATLAYDAATGTREWLARYDGPANLGGLAPSIAVSPGGGTLYITGTVEGGHKSALDYGTVAYSTAAGSQRWTAQLTGPGARNDQACCVAVSPSASMIFVTGSSERPGHGADYATVAYHR